MKCISANVSLKFIELEEFGCHNEIDMQLTTQVQISRITNNVLCHMQHKVIGVHDLLIYDTVCFIFPVCTGLKETVVWEEEMNVLKSIKYLYTGKSLLGSCFIW